MMTALLQGLALQLGKHKMPQSLEARSADRARGGDGFGSALYAHL